MNIRAYVRADGRIGIRNKVIVLPSVACVNNVAFAIAQRVKGVVNIRHEVGCAQVGDDFRQTYKTLVGIGSNPNVAGVLVLGLGCERVIPQELAHDISKSNKPVECLILQEEGGTTNTISKGIDILSEITQKIQQERQEVTISSLKIAVECGGSDYTSALAANPAIGYAVDKLCNMKAKIVISELIELIGTESFLEKRCQNSEIALKLRKAIERVAEESQKYTRDELEANLIPNNISPGNVRGGITTIEEKSLGAVSKGGYQCPIMGFLSYAEKIPDVEGLYVMDTPSYDIESLTGMVAGGCTLALFSTGLGTPVGNPIVPVIKITGNNKTATRMRTDIDVDVSDVLTKSRSLEEASEKIIKEIIEIASGKLSKSEILNYSDIGINRIGPRL